MYDPALQVDTAVTSLSRVHHAFMRPMLQDGRMPTRAAVSAALGITVQALDETLNMLAATHGVVLDPHSHEPCVMHPFSATPTATWAEHGERGWWAPCPWCAFGIAGLVGRNATIHARLGGEREPIAIHVVDGHVAEDDLWVHFAVPPRDAWNNVHRFCATLLVFRDKADIAPWCAQHGTPEGEAVPIAQVWDLGRDWYARHADPDWRKWTGAEAAAIFDGNGLGGAFWRFPRSDQPF